MFQWHRITKELPKKSGNYLVCGGEESICVSYWDDEQKIWLFENQNEDDEIENEMIIKWPVYWTELPLPPWESNQNISEQFGCILRELDRLGLKASRLYKPDGTIVVTVRCKA